MKNERLRAFRQSLPVVVLLVAFLVFSFFINNAEPEPRPSRRPVFDCDQIFLDADGGFTDDPIAMDRWVDCVESQPEAVEPRFP